MIKKNYVGINYDSYHDSSVAYFTDKIEYIGAEERFSRVKKDGRRPNSALKYLYENYKIDKENTVFVFPILEKEISENEWAKSGLIDTYNVIAKELDYGLDYAKSITTNPVFVRHHDAHAASAYFTSGFEEKTLICTIDGGNLFDPYSTNIYEGFAGKIQAIKRIPDISIASNYLLITAALGFKPLEHEGKITGLSSYGKYNENLISKLKNILSDKNIIHEATKWINIGSQELPPKIQITEKIQVFDEILNQYNREDIAFAIQYLTEQAVKNLLDQYIGKYEYIALAGGLFANVKLNSFIKDLGFKNIFVHPAMGDDGLALGAILYAKSVNEGLKPFQMDNVFYGSSYSDEGVEEIIKSNGLTFEKYENIEKQIIDKLSEGKIIARYLGRQEYGPRALGHRSILCHADDPNINHSLNEKLVRTEFMPFAPVVADYQTKELFENIDGAEYTARFMTITRKCTTLMNEVGKAAVHIDNTARPQIVTSNTDDSYYKIIDGYYKKTNGRSILINTSFNMHGEPIVSTPEEAIKSFKRAKLDYLALNNYLIYIK
ncbi:MAG: hypothetical protein NTX96_00150 [Candidatus Zambryskibacteria bacterium]|nr:hypothetical protein [Candidatus Zambryskibacteria bacterium]